MDKTIIINDSRCSGDRFRFAYAGSWGFDSGMPLRFEGGDEHWSTNALCGEEHPSFTLTFTGHAVRLYGHKVPVGALCAVTLDGETVGSIDYSSPERVERTLLFALDSLSEGEHTLTVTVTPRPDTAQYELSIDYAEVDCDALTFPPEGISLTPGNLFLAAGMTYPLSYRILPEFATFTPRVRFSSDNEAVATVSEDGVIRAVGGGKAVVTAALEGMELSDALTVEVSETLHGFVGTVGDDNEHTNPGDFFPALRTLSEERRTGWRGCAFRRDTALAKFDLFALLNAVHGARAEISDFRCGVDTIPAACADLRFMTPTLAHDTGHLVCDCIDQNGPADFAPSSVHTLFVRIEVPADAEPGLYRAVLRVISEDAEPISFDLALEVLPYTLPETRDMPFQMELWMYPYSAERYYSGRDTADYFGEGISRLPYVHLTGEADEGLRSQLALYARAGGKAITVTCVEDPWNTQTHDPYPSMIKWHWHGGDDFTFDYTDFDKWVQMNLDCGITGQIKTFSIASWGNRIAYITDDGEVRAETLTPNSERWRAVWSAFLRDYMRHTLEKGWFDITYMSMDEREPEDIEAMLDLNDTVKTPDGRSFKTSMAVFRWDAEYLFDRLDDLSLAYGMDGARVEQIARQRRANGRLTTLYTCGAQCSALENPPYESEYSMLYTAKRHTDGFLRWALDSFNANPIESSAHRLFAAGDLYMIYPDHPGAGQQAKSSHRFEKIAAGVRDVEKIRVLRRALPERAEQINALLDSLGTKGDPKSELLRVMNALYDLARES